MKRTFWSEGAEAPGLVAIRNDFLSGIEREKNNGIHRASWTISIAPLMIRLICFS